MFPLAHNYMTERIIALAPPPFDRSFSERERRLMCVGSILPDFVSGMGLDRNAWHLEEGERLYHYARSLSAEHEALALGVRLHGIDGCGFDTYADEIWQGKMGWCFLECLPYIPDAVLACNLPRNFALWKAHNLVELAAELEVAGQRPEIGLRLKQAIHDEEVMGLIAELLGSYAGAPEERVRGVLQTMDERFSIINVTPEDCAEKYLRQLERRHGITGGSREELAALLERIRGDLREKLWLWFAEVEELICAAFRQSLNQPEG